MLNYHVVLDVLESGVQQTINGFFCGDTEKKQLCITLVRQGEKYAIPAGGAAALTAVKPDQTSVSHPCPISDGQILYVPSAQTLAVTGMVHCQVIVYGVDHSVLYSPKFDLTVEPALIDPESAASADEFSLLPISVLSNLADADGALTYQDACVGAVEAVQTFFDLPLGCTGQLAFVRTTVGSYPRGFYRFGTQWEHLTVDSHTHGNLAALNQLSAQNGYLYIGAGAVGSILTVRNNNELPGNIPDGMLAFNTTSRQLLRSAQNEWFLIYNGANAHTHSNQSALDAVTQNTVDAAHTHANSAVLASLNDDGSGNLTYGGRPIQPTDDEPPTPLCLGVTYDALAVRSDWADVPVWVTDSIFELALYNQDGSSGISLIETTDYDTGLPVLLLRVKRSGDIYACFPRDTQGIVNAYTAGWYDTNDDPCGAPSLSGLRFDKLVVGNDEYDDLTNLPAKAQSALETLSRMVNVSPAAMGGRGEKPDGVERFAGVLETGRHYSFITTIPFTPDLPDAPPAGAQTDIVLDLHCAQQNVTVTLPRDKLLDGGTLPDTRQGHHTLTFTYIPAAGKWSVGCVNRVQPQVWDDIPDEVTTLENCTWAQIKAIAAHGYKNRYGQWCIRRNNAEEVWFEIGDEKTLAVGNETWTLQIWDFQHDDKSDGSGKAPITFGLKTGSSTTYRMNQTNTTAGGWDQSYMRQNVFPTIYAALPAALKDVIEPVTKVSYLAQNIPDETTDNIWLASIYEYTGSTQVWTGQYTAVAVEGEKYAIFNSAAQKAFAADYWTRSIPNISSTTQFMTILSSGSSYDMVNASAGRRIRLGFCV